MSRSSCPIDAHLPHDFLPGERLRLEAYRKLAAIGSEEDLEAVRAELVDRYGELPDAGREPAGRGAVPDLGPPGRPVGGRAGRQQRPVRAGGAAGERAAAAAAAVPGIAREARGPVFGVPAESRAQRAIGGVATILVPKPMTARVGGQPLRDVALLDWCREVVEAVLPPATAAPADPAAAEGPR